MTLAATPAFKPIAKQEVLDKYRELQQRIAAWDDSREPSLFVQWNGQTVKTISKDLEEAFAELALFLNTDKFQESAWRVVFALDKFVDAVFEWARNINSDTRKNSPQGSPEMWSAWQMIERSLIEPRFGKVESIRQLIAERVERPQICRMYGFVDEYDRPDITKLEEEIESPGKHTTGWEHPDAVRYRNEMHERWQQRSFDLQRGNREQEIESAFSDEPASASWVEPGEAPEHVAELLSLPGITIGQVARMKNMTPEEVRQIAIDLRIPVDAGIMAEIAQLNMDNAVDRREVTANPEGVREKIDRGTVLQSSKVNTYKDLGRLEVRVLAMADDGVTPGKIVLAMREEMPDLTYERVSRIIAHKDAIVEEKSKVVVESRRAYKQRPGRSPQGRQGASEGQSGTTIRTPEGDEPALTQLESDIDQL